MKRAPDPTPADHRRFDRLLWGPEGIHEEALRRDWEGFIATFGATRTHQFTAFGHRWTLSFDASLWSKHLEVGVGLWPERLLPEKETVRLQSTGFYEDFAALFRSWGYVSSSVNPRGGMGCRRLIPSSSEISSAQKRFESLDLVRVPTISRRGLPPDRRRNFADLLRWMRRARGWRTGCVEFRVSSPWRVGGVRWKTRFDLLVGATNSCSWFYAWPPNRFDRSDRRRVERTGFFQRTTEELLALGFEGSWRPGLFTDPDRLAAEFWKPTRDPRTTRKDFEALLRWRLRDS